MKTGDVTSTEALVCSWDHYYIFLGMTYLTTHNAIIACGNSIIWFPKRGITLTCRKGSNTRFSAMTNSNTPDFISKFPDVFPSRKITELRPWRQINHHINLIKGKMAPSPQMFMVSDKILPAYRQIIEDWKVKNIIYPCEANNPVNKFPKLKPNGEIRLLADLVPWNDITIKKDTTIPNPSIFLRTVARDKYRSCNWYRLCLVSSIVWSSVCVMIVFDTHDVLCLVSSIVWYSVCFSYCVKVSVILDMFYVTFQGYRLGSLYGYCLQGSGKPDQCI